MEKRNNGKSFENQAMRANRKKYRNWYRNRILAVVLCLSLVFGLCPVFPGLGGYEEAHAEPNNTGSSIYTGRELGTDVLNTTEVNTPQTPVVYYAGVPWYVVGYNGIATGADPESVLSHLGEVTLLAKNNLDDITLNYDNNDNVNETEGRTEHSNEYNGSLLQKYLDNVYTGSGNGNDKIKFSASEKIAVETRDLEGGNKRNDNGFTGQWNEDTIRGLDVKNAGLWPLSVKEALALYPLNNGTDIIRKNGSFWWLRSPGYYAYYACYVNNNGNVNSDGYYVSHSFGVRPAFYLNLQSVIFSSKIQDATDSAGAEYKLTLTDPEIKLAVTEYTAPINDTTTATVKYKLTSSDAGKVDKISVLILPCTYVPGMSLTDILYYGELSTELTDSIKTNGEVETGTFELPSDLKNKKAGIDYYIYLLAEDVNDGNLTDYASEPVPVTNFKTVTGLVMGSINTEDVNTADSPVVYYAGKPWYMIGYDKEHSDENVLSESGAATLLVKDNLGTSAFDTDENRGGGENSRCNKYAGSLFQKYLDKVFSGSGDQTVKFSSQEKDAVKPRTLIGGGGLYNTNSNKKDNEGNVYDEDKIRGSQVDNAGLWPLSVKEANKLYNNDENDSIRANGSSWWLRSPGDYADLAAYVGRYGHVYSNGYRMYNVDGYDGNDGVRPAFYLNLQSVIFSSKIYPAPADVSAGAAHKLTLKDDKISIGLQADKIITRTGNVVSIPCSISNTDQSGNPGAEVNQISLMILDKVYTPGNTNGAKLLCYKILSKAEANSEFSGEGNISFTLPKDFARKLCGTDYHAYIIAESVNDQLTDGVNNLKNTDYAGTPLEITIPHGHDFSYAAGTGNDANSVIATCLNKGCSGLTDGKIILTIEAPAHNTYGDEKTADAVLSGLDAFNEATKLNISSNDIKYSGREGTTYNENTVPPVAAGKYRAEITVENITVGVDYEIKQKEVTVSEIKAKSKAYNGTKEAELDYSDVVLTGVLEDDKAKIGISASGEFTDAKAGKNKTVNISNLVLTDKVSSGSGSVIGNYILAVTNQQTEASAEIYKADSSISELPVAKTGLVYTGDNLELITKGQAENGTLVYAVTEKGAAAPDDNKYSADIPTSVNAGEYTVYYKVIGNENYNDVNPDKLNVKIQKASQEPPILNSTSESERGKNDGSIYGLTTNMEIRYGFNPYKAVNSGSLSRLAPGEYYVRYAEDKNHFRSDDTVVVIQFGPKNKKEPNLTAQPSVDKGVNVSTPVLEEPDTGSKTVNNEDGSTTTTTKTKNEDGTITESTVREWENGDKNVTEIIKDADGKVLSTLVGTVRISKKGTRTEKTDIQKADGFHSNSSVKTYKSGKKVTSSSTTFANGAKQAYTETKNADGTLTRKVMDTNTKGKSTLTVTTKNLIKTVTKYKVTGDGKIRLTNIKTDGDTAIIPKTVTFDGQKNMIVSLGKGLFKGMEGIKEIYIYAENLKKIYAGAFNGVPADVKFFIKANDANIKKIVRMIKKSGFGKVDYTKI